MITLACYSDKVNDINFENMTNDDAVRTLREIVSAASGQWNSLLGSKAGTGFWLKALGNSQCDGTLTL